MPLLELTPLREPTRLVVLGLAGIVLFILAGRDLHSQHLSLVTAAALVISVVACMAAAAMCDVREAAPMPATSYGVRIPLLVTAVVLAAGAWLSSGTGSYTHTNLAFWPAAIAAWLLAWWPRGRSVKIPSPSRSDAATLVALGAVVCVACFFHFHQLSTVPGEPTSDHAEKLLDVRDVLNGEHPIFFARNTGREPAQFYATAALIKWFGQPLSWETLKLGTALVGVLAVFAIFLLGRELGGRSIGLTASTFAAVSHWPVGVDRIGLRFSYAILASALTLWLVLRYLRTGDRKDALLCGLAIAFGLHGYSPFRVVLLAVGLVFAAAAVRAGGSGARRVVLADAGLAYATAFVAAIPLVHYALQRPDLVLMRQSSRLDGSLGLGGSLSTFGDNLTGALLAFNWQGGKIWSVAVVQEPFLDLVTGAALLSGVVVLATIATLRRSIVAGLILLLVPVLTLGSALNLAFPDENPAANRMGVSAPLVFAVAAVPIGLLWHALWTTAWSAGARSLRVVFGALGVGLLVSSLAVVVTTNYRSYFRDYRTGYSLNDEHTSEVVRALEAEGVPSRRVFLVSFPHWLDARNLGFELGDPDWYVEHNIEPGMPIPPPVDGGRVVYVLAGEDRASRGALARRFPAGRYAAVRASVPAQDFGLYVVQAPH